MKKSKTTKNSPVWIIRGDSESGDHYPPKRYNHKPTEMDKKDYILNQTPEDIEIDGDFGSCVYLTIEKL